MEQVCSRYNEPTQALTFRKGRDNSKDSDRLLCCGLPFRTQPQTLRPYICISILHQSPRSSAARWLCCSWDMWGDAQGIAPGKIKKCGQKRQWYETKEDDIMKLDTLVISLLKNLSKYEICWNAFAWNAWVPNLDPCEPDMGYKYKLWILKTDSLEQRGALWIHGIHGATGKCLSNLFQPCLCSTPELALELSLAIKVAHVLNNV